MLTVTNVGQGIPGIDDVQVEYVYRGRYGISGQPLNCLEDNFTQRFTPGTP